MLQVVVTAQVSHLYIALLQLSLPCFSAAKCSKHCSLYRKFWGIVTLFIKFIRACGSVFGIFLLCDGDRGLQRAFSHKDTTKSSINCLHKQ